MKYWLALTLLIAMPSFAGFTEVEPSEDSRVLYVSSSEGSDDNDCLSEQEPCKSIHEAVSKMRKGSPDHLYLKAGDTWRGNRFFSGQNVSGRSPQERAVVGVYGEGDRPILEADEKSVSIFKDSISFKHVLIQGLHFYAYKMDPDHPEFDGATHGTFYMIARNDNLTLEDNKFDLIELIVQGINGEDPSNITIRRNIFTGAYVNTSSYSQKSRPSNIYAAQVDGLTIEQNVFDHGGWHPDVKGASANMYNHNLYIQASVVGDKVLLKENIITRGSASGVQLRAGGVAENNFFARNASALSLGYKDKPISSGARAHAIDNVITEGHSMYKGVDPCEGPNLCTGAVWGLVAPPEEVGNADLKLEGNLVHSHSEADTQYKEMDKSLYFQTLGETVVGWEKGSHNQGRTLADYNKSLGGEHSFEAFMEKALNRPRGEWPEELSAKSINNYIRTGVVQEVEPKEEPTPVGEIPEKAIPPEVSPVDIMPTRFSCEMTCTPK